MQRLNVDVSNWPTKQEAALQLAVSAREIDLLLKQGRLRKRMRRGSGRPVVVIDPESVDECRLDPAPRASVALAGIVEPSVVPARSLGAAGGLEAALVAFLQSKTAGSLVQVERRLFLTMAECAEYSGLPAAFLRKLIASGKLKALKTGAGWRVARVELEKLAGTLTETPADPTEHELRDLELNRRRRQGL
jgi:excisionase family DNA binding protein